MLGGEALDRLDRDLSTAQARRRLGVLKDRLREGVAFVFVLAAHLVEELRLRVLRGEPGDVSETGADAFDVRLEFLLELRELRLLFAHLAVALLEAILGVGDLLEFAVEGVLPLVEALLILLELRGLLRDLAVVFLAALRRLLFRLERDALPFGVTLGARGLKRLLGVLPRLLDDVADEDAQHHVGQETSGERAERRGKSGMKGGGKERGHEADLLSGGHLCPDAQGDGDDTNTDAQRRCGVFLGVSAPAAEPPHALFPHRPNLVLPRSAPP